MSNVHNINILKCKMSKDLHDLLTVKTMCNTVKIAKTAKTNHAAQK